MALTFPLGLGRLFFFFPFFLEILGTVLSHNYEGSALPHSRGAVGIQGDLDRDYKGTYSRVLPVCQTQCQAGGAMMVRKLRHGPHSVQRRGL